jgi:hypothetical protein
MSVVQAQKSYTGDEVGLDVYHRLLWGDKILYCTIIKWFDHVWMGVKKIHLASKKHYHVACYVIKSVHTHSKKNIHTLRPMKENLVLNTFEYTISQVNAVNFMWDRHKRP